MKKLLAALFAITLVACQTATPGGDPESLSTQGLGATVETAIDDIDAEDGGDVLMDLDLSDDLVDAERAERLQTVRDLLTAMAEDEPCALRGLLGGRYEPVDDEEFDGVFGGRAYRGYETLVAVGEGTYTDEDDTEPGGTWEGAYSAFENGEGLIDGTWDPSAVIDGIRLGVFEGGWVPSDGAHDGGNIAGLWHPTTDGGGLFLGYWSRCDAEPAAE